MSPAAIPRLQSARVALYEQRFGKFDSGKNAYWSLRKERPVTLAEGARFDVEMRTGRLAPVVRAPIPVALVEHAPLRTRPFVGRPPPILLTEPARPIMMTTMRLGWWRNAQTGRVVMGTMQKPPDRMTGWSWSLRAPPPGVLGRGTLGPAIPPQEKLLHMPTEAKRIAALPATPPPGPARPPKEPLFEAIMRQLRERQAGPATEVLATRPAFATPARPLAAAAPALTMAGFDMKKLALPLALVAGAFVVSKLI